jgi:hypothetical protein
MTTSIDELYALAVETGNLVAILHLTDARTFRAKGWTQTACVFADMARDALKGTTSAPVAVSA